MFQDLEDSKNDLPKIPRFHTRPELQKNCKHVTKNVFASIGFTYVLRFGDFKVLSRVHRRIFPLLFENIEILMVSRYVEGEPRTFG